MPPDTRVEPSVHHTRCDLAGVAPIVSLSTGIHNRIVVERPRLFRPRQTPLTCAPDAALGLPWSGGGSRHFIAFVLTAVARALEIDEPVVLVVGHAAVGERSELEGHGFWGRASRPPDFSGRARR